MNNERYEELVSLYMDGEPDEIQLEELAQILKADPSLAQDFQKQLTVWDAWSQETVPERSAEAFLAGFNTRIRAEKDAPAFELSVTNKLKSRKHPLPFLPLIAVASTAILMLLFSAIVLNSSQTNKTQVATKTYGPNHLCIHGECVCTRCTLQLTEDHQRAIRYKTREGTTEIVYLENDPNMNMNMNYFCHGPTPVLVEGMVEDQQGRQVLVASEFRAFPNQQTQHPNLKDDRLTALN